MSGGRSAFRFPRRERLEDDFEPRVCPSASEQYARTEQTPAGLVLTPLKRKGVVPGPTHQSFPALTNIPRKRLAVHLFDGASRA